MQIRYQLKQKGSEIKIRIDFDVWSRFLFNYSMETNAYQFVFKILNIWLCDSSLFVFYIRVYQQVLLICLCHNGLNRNWLAFILLIEIGVQIFTRKKTEILNKLSITSTAQFLLSGNSMRPECRTSKLSVLWHFAVEIC